VRHVVGAGRRASPTPRSCDLGQQLDLLAGYRFTALFLTESYDLV